MSIRTVCAKFYGVHIVTLRSPMYSTRQCLYRPTIMHSVSDYSSVSLKLIISKTA
jgi:hypothetical protein